MIILVCLTPEPKLSNTLFANCLFLWTHPTALCKNLLVEVTGTPPPIPGLPYPLAFESCCESSCPHHAQQRTVQGAVCPALQHQHHKFIRCHSFLLSACKPSDQGRGLWLTWHIIYRSLWKKSVYPSPFLGMIRENVIQAPFENSQSISYYFHTSLGPVIMAFNLHSVGPWGSKRVLGPGKAQALHRSIPLYLIQGFMEDFIH